MCTFGKKLTLGWKSLSIFWVIWSRFIFYNFQLEISLLSIVKADANASNIFIKQGYVHFESKSSFLSAVVFLLLGVTSFHLCANSFFLMCPYFLKPRKLELKNLVYHNVSICWHRARHCSVRSWCFFFSFGISRPNCFLRLFIFALIEVMNHACYNQCDKCPISKVLL